MIFNLQYFQSIQRLRMSDLKTFKFVFTAYLGELTLKANVSSPTFVTWKRSQQSATSQTVEMVNGKAEFQNEALKLPVSMYFDVDAQCFKEKKTSFSYTMKTPKGEKTAGVVYIDLSKMLNSKLEEINEEFPLQKCPLKDSTARIRVTSECLGEKANDTFSQASTTNFGSSTSIPSMPSTISQFKADEPEPKVEKASESKSVKSDSKTTAPSTTPSNSGDKDAQIKLLKEKLGMLERENKGLKKELEAAKESVKGDNLKEQFLKSKALQDKLEEEVNTLKKQNQEHEKELEDARKKLEEAYTNLYSSLSKHFL